MILITCPKFCKEEILYTLDIIFKYRLNLKYSLAYSEDNHIRVEMDGKAIKLNITFFETLNKSGRVETDYLNNFPSWNRNMVSWDILLIKDNLPIIFGDPEVRDKGEVIEIGFDIVGTIFFMLSRYEEVNATSLDQYERFLAKNSLSYKGGFLMRPIADEYIEILWASMKHLWPNLRRKKEMFSIVPTHDVDNPFLNIGLISFWSLIRRIIGDVIHRKSLLLMCSTLYGWAKFKMGGNLRYKNDPYDVFARILSTSKRYNIKNKFYFMTLKESSGPLFGRYNISSKEIKSLVKEIYSQGHEIGFHPTGKSFKDFKAFEKQAQAYFALKKELNIIGKSGGRQHYLLWKPDRTPLNWEKSGFEYDSTLTYVDHVGFRCGTCKPFPLWNHQEKRKIGIVEQPLIMMEGSLMSQKSMGSNYEEAKEIIDELKSACKCVNGNFVFLWHNSSFLCEQDWSLYEQCLRRD